MTRYLITGLIAFAVTMTALVISAVTTNEETDMLAVGIAVMAFFMLSLIFVMALGKNGELFKHLFETIWCTEHFINMLTLGIACLYCTMLWFGKTIPPHFENIVIMVLTFYYGTKGMQKKNGHGHGESK